MNWTLLIPGALLPPALAPELTRHMHAPVLAAHLALARPLPARADEDIADTHGVAASQAAHWQWLASRFVPDAEDLPTAPYAWRVVSPHGTGGGAHRPGGADDSGVWIAHCDPVHMAIARDHFMVTDLAGAPLLAPESAELLDRANAVLAAEACVSPAALAPRLRIAVRGGRWFLLSPRPLDLRTWSLDAVLGQSVQDRLPTGADARRWRVLGNEIQMSWHASNTNDARETSGLRTANALWVHGGGVWQHLGRAAQYALLADDAPAEATVLRGWMDAADRCADAVQAPARPATLSICRALFNAHAHQAWESWLAQLPLIDARIGSDLAAARAAGATRFDLVLCGSATTRTVTLPLQTHWWRRFRFGAHAPGALLQRFLADTPTARKPASRASGALAA